MDIDEARRHDLAGCVNDSVRHRHLGARAEYGQPITHDRDAPRETGRARSVDNRAPAYQDIDAVSHQVARRRPLTQAPRIMPSGADR